MNPPVITKKELVKYAFFSLLIICLIFLLQTYNKQTKIVFCDVGQGDAIYIRIKNKVDVLIDAGPDKKVLNCLGKYMPFWDRKIEIAILSHHDKDHYYGFFNIIKRYKIDDFLTINYKFDTATYQSLVKEIKNKKIHYDFIYENEKIKIKNSYFEFLWPPKNLKSNDSNDYSLIFLFNENNFRVLFTGDASPKSLNIVRTIHKLSLQKKINILKIPHHGSKNGLTKKFLDLAAPEIAVISVGKNNSYGHPHKEILDMLKALKIKIKRTDIDNDIIFKLPK